MLFMGVFFTMRLKLSLEKNILINDDPYFSLPRLNFTLLLED